MKLPGQTKKKNDTPEKALKGGFFPPLSLEGQKLVHNSKRMLVAKGANYSRTAKEYLDGKYGPQSRLIKINRTHGAGRPNFLQQPTPINQ